MQGTGQVSWASTLSSHPPVVVKRMNLLPMCKQALPNVIAGNASTRNVTQTLQRGADRISSHRRQTKKTATYARTIHKSASIPWLDNSGTCPNWAAISLHLDPLSVNLYGLGVILGLTNYHRISFSRW